MTLLQPSTATDTTKRLRCAAYVRLSQEDGDKVESDSVVNQKQLIREYVNNHAELTIVEEYADDGYSGVNFDRPGFVKMMEDVRNGAIDCIIVKDLSRLGRNYMEVGKYLEIIFPSLHIRFIAINDNVDTGCTQTDADIFTIPFKILFNDMYSRDIHLRSAPSWMSNVNGAISWEILPVTDTKRIPRVTTISLLIRRRQMWFVKFLS